MSHRNDPGLPLEPGTYSTGGGETTSTAKDESVAVTHAATDAAKGVGQRAQEEGGAVRDEARDQFHDLYDQTRSELADQAMKQQDRIATSLQTLGGDLDTMARSSEETGLAKDLVTETSQRATQFASWLHDREPGEVLDEVKAFARRQPGMFIGAAAVAGILAGRLTRSLAANAREQTESSDGAGQGSGVPPVDRSTQQAARPRQETASPTLPGTVRQPAPGTTPRPSPATNPAGEEDRDERPHTF